jgi:DNA-binding NarL/FixJ family response regulator
MGQASTVEQLNELEARLTHHQVAILQWVANGKRNEDIALLMGLSRPQTVQAHIQRIMDATGTGSRAGAVAWAMRRKLIS